VHRDCGRPVLITDVPDGVLAVYAHPDDAEVACGGTLASWAAGGAAVHLVIACRGDKGTLEEGADADALAQLRVEEVAAGATALGLAGYELLGYPDGELDDSPALRGALVAAIRRLRPGAVVCPDPTAAFFGRTYINHRDHRVVGWATLYFPATGAPHRVAAVYLSGTLEPDTFVDVEAGLDAKAAALQCHRTQVRGSADVLEAAVRRRAADAGRAAGVRYAEGFRLLTPS